MQGIVKWFDDKLGYGFIESSEADKDIFVHFKEIKMKGFKTLKEGEKVEFEVSGDKIEAIHMIPGWTHNIINLSDTEDLVTVMTCNEIFDPSHPDTFGEPV